MARSRRPRRDWSEGLPPELLDVVLLYLPCLADRVYFAAVCRAWRSAAVCLARRSAAGGLAPPRQLPWLLLPCPNASSFFSLQSRGATRRIYLPECVRDARFCGSHGGGWVTVASHAWGGHAATNILSGARVPLPNRLKFRLLGGHGGVARTGSEHSLLLRTVVFSAAPSSAGCVAAAHVSSATNLAFWRPGMAHWAASRHLVDGLEDMIYYKGEVWQGFHVLTSKEDVMVYTPYGVDGPLDMSRSDYGVQKRVGYFLDQNETVSSVTRYLVESRGKLLMVLRYHTGQRRIVRSTLMFRIFEMKIVFQPNGDFKASWMQLDELSGRVLFLGRGCSRAFEVSEFDRLQEGSIYYLDDARFDVSVVLDNGKNFSSADMGLIVHSTFKPRSGVPKFPRRFTSESSPPIWFFP